MFHSKRWLQIFLIVLILCFIFSCSAIKAIKLIKSGEAYQTDKKGVTIPFNLAGHLILITAQINNSPKKYNFIFDTGALTVIDDDVAEEFQLKKSISITGKGSSGSSKTIRLNKLRSLNIGEIGVKDCAVAVFDLAKMDKDIDGILGSNFLRHFKVILDYRNRIIKFVHQFKFEDNTNTDLITIPFEQDFKNGFAPKIKCLINNRWKIDGIIDTGSSELASLPLSAMKKMPAFNNGKILASNGSMSGGAFGRSEKEFLLRVNKLKIGDFELMDFASQSNNTQKILIGKSFLSNFIVRLDYPNGEMILQPYSETNIKHEIYTYGVALDKKQDKTLCTGVWENSSADKNGIKPGDEFISVNSQKTSELSMIELMLLFRYKESSELELVYLSNGKRNKVTLQKEKLVPPGE